MTGGARADRGLTVLWALLLVAAAAVAAGALFRFPPGWTAADREARTRARLDEVAAGLVALQWDTGRFPDPAPGALSALLVGSGDPRWRGPYVSSALRLQDGWGGDLAYRRGGPGDSAALVAAPGPGGVLEVEADWDGGAWTPHGDDLGVVVLADSDAHRAATRRRLDDLAEAILARRARESTFPAALDELAPELVPASDLRDAWGRPFEYRAAGGTALVWSRGLDGLDEVGRGDDPSALVGLETFAGRAVLEAAADPASGALELEHDSVRTPLGPAPVRFELGCPGGEFRIVPTDPDGDAPPFRLDFVGEE